MDADSTGLDLPAAPDPRGGPRELDADPARAGELTAARTELRRDLTAGPWAVQLPPEDVDRLLLAFEELASSGLRHGRAAVEVRVDGRRSAQGRSGRCRVRSLSDRHDPHRSTGAGAVIGSRSMATTVSQLPHRS